jgi:hypothetical protein
MAGSAESFEITVNRRNASGKMPATIIYTTANGKKTTIDLYDGVTFKRDNFPRDGKWYIGGDIGGVTLDDERPSDNPRQRVQNYLHFFGNPTILTGTANMPAIREDATYYGYTVTIDPLLATNIRTYLKEVVKNQKKNQIYNGLLNRTSPAMEGVSFTAPDFKQTISKAEMKASAEGLATVSAMWNRQQRPEAAASNAAAAPAPGRDGLPPDVTRNIAAMLGLPKKGGKSRRKKQTTRRKRVHKRGNTKLF